MAKKTDPMTIKGVFLIVVGVFVWLNDGYAWFTWPQAVAVIIAVAGLKKLYMKKC